MHRNQTARKHRPSQSRRYGMTSFGILLAALFITSEWIHTAHAQGVDPQPRRSSQSSSAGTGAAWGDNRAGALRTGMSPAGVTPERRPNAASNGSRSTLTRSASGMLSGALGGQNGLNTLGQTSPGNSQKVRNMVDALEYVDLTQCECVDQRDNLCSDEIDDQFLNMVESSRLSFQEVEIPSQSVRGNGNPMDIRALQNSRTRGGFFDIRKSGIRTFEAKYYSGNQSRASRRGSRTYDSGDTEFVLDFEFEQVSSNRVDVVECYGIALESGSRDRGYDRYDSDYDTYSRDSRYGDFPAGSNPPKRQSNRSRNAGTNSVRNLPTAILGGVQRGLSDSLMDIQEGIGGSGSGLGLGEDLGSTIGDGISGFIGDAVGGIFGGDDEDDRGPAGLTDEQIADDAQKKGAIFSTE